MKILTFLCIMMTLASCEVYLKNRIMIVSGTYRVLTYDSTEIDSIIAIRPAAKNDSILGIGIVFKTEFLTDYTEKTSLINTSTQGDKGVIDSIIQIEVVIEKQEITPFLKNRAATKLTHFKMEMDERHPLGVYVYSNWRTASFQADAFLDIENFIDRYNKNQGFGIDQEFFFWLDAKGKDIGYEDLINLDFTIRFNDDREVRLDYFSGSFSKEIVEL